MESVGNLEYGKFKEIWNQLIFNSSYSEKSFLYNFLFRSICIAGYFLNDFWNFEPFFEVVEFKDAH